MSKVLKNALAGVAAQMCAGDAQDDTDYVATRVSCKRLKTLHGYNGSLIDESHPRFAALKAAGHIEPALTDSDKFLRVLNATMGLSMRVGNTAGRNDGAYEFQPTEDLFQHYSSVQQFAQTDRSVHVDSRSFDPIPLVYAWKVQIQQDS